MKAVAYYHVSTYLQGKSGLGLEAQQGAVEQFITVHGYEIAGEYPSGSSLVIFETQLGGYVEKTKANGIRQHPKPLTSSVVVTKSRLKGILGGLCVMLQA